MRKYQVTITGKTALLMHADNIDWSDKMNDWQIANKKNSTPGDDRTPAWRWVGSVYNDGNFVTMPSDNLMRCFMEAGAMVSTGKGPKTFKSQTQSGMMLSEGHWRLTCGGKPIPWKQIEALTKINDLKENVAAVQAMGFRLFTKRARIGQAKHVRVRPRFDRWELTGVLNVWDEQITENVVREILRNAGDFKGLGDWRPGSKTPGSFGMFDAEVKEI